MERGKGQREEEEEEGEEGGGGGGGWFLLLRPIPRSLPGRGGVLTSLSFPFISFASIPFPSAPSRTALHSPTYTLGGLVGMGGWS